MEQQGKRGDGNQEPAGVGAQEATGAPGWGCVLQGRRGLYPACYRGRPCGTRKMQSIKWLQEGGNWGGRCNEMGLRDQGRTGAAVCGCATNAGMSGGHGCTGTGRTWGEDACRLGWSRQRAGELLWAQVWWAAAALGAGGNNCRASRVCAAGAAPNGGVLAKWWCGRRRDAQTHVSCGRRQVPLRQPQRGMPHLLSKGTEAGRFTGRRRRGT